MNVSKKSILIGFLLFVAVTFTQAQVGIGTITTNASAILDLSGDGSKGLLLPRMSTTQRNASNGILSPVGGIIIYDTDEGCLMVSLDNGKWKNLCTGVETVVTTGTTSSIGKVGLGTVTPDKNTIVDIVSTSKGVLLPISTTDLSTVQGMVYFNNSTNSFRLYTSLWNTIVAY